MRTTDERPRFEGVDWTEVDRSNRLLSPERGSFLLGVALLWALYLYDAYVTGLYLVGTWTVELLDWLILFGLLAITSFVLVPAVRRRERTKRILRRVLSHPPRAIALGYLGVFSVVALFGPAVLGSPELNFGYRFQAPIGFVGETSWSSYCHGAVIEGEGITRYCEGTWTYPLGTNHRGHPLGHLLVVGARVAFYVLVFAAAFVVPVAATVGIVAGFRGGLLDDLLMGYVDVQLCIPAIVVFFIGYMYWNVSLLLLLVTFGLLSWGGIARLVRSEVLQRREEGYVLVARSLGASPTYIGRRHIIPNSTNTLVPAVFHLFALLVLVEAGVAFLGFHHVETYSWGSTIQEGLDPNYVGIGLQMNPHEVWWVSTLPAIALTLTLTSLKLVGDGLRDALDPRRER